MPSREAIIEALREILDPEMPISIVDLGIVERVDIEPGTDNGKGVGDDSARVTIEILPTFVGCPALGMIEEMVRDKVSAMPGVDEVEVNFVYDPPWTVDRITEEGRASLKEHGVTVPEKGSKLPVHEKPAVMTRIGTSAVACPFCGSSSTYLDSPFGPTRCRMIYYCQSCRNSFEHLKRV